MPAEQHPNETWGSELGRYFNVRGFLDCDEREIDQIRRIVDSYRSRGDDFFLKSEVLDGYLSGWVYGPVGVNWTSYAFFGCSMRAGGVDLVHAILRHIARELTEVEGTFHIDDDEGLEALCWHMSAGLVSATPR